MTDSEDPEVAAMRERAERVMAKRAAARAEAATGAKTEEAPKKKAGRRWYHWVIDAALFALLAYVIKVRFFTKEPAAPENAPASSASSSASAAPSASGVATRASAELRLGPGTHYAAVETLPPNTAVEIVGAPAEGWFHVRVTASGKTGWLPLATFSPPSHP